MNYEHLLCYLLAERPPQLDEQSVYEKIKKLKNTRSIFHIDLPNKLIKEFAAELADPLENIKNSCLEEQYYPKLWKYEIVSTHPKVTHPKLINDLRNISSTSDFSKVFDSFLRDWILEDISSKIDIGQYRGQAGTGTEHMMIFLVDRILKLLDSTNGRAAVIASLIDLANAFDRLDPTLAIEKFIQMGVRASSIPLLCINLENRKMRVKYKGELPEEHTMAGSGPQGTLLGLIEYLVQSNTAAACISDDDRFKYIDDLSILELVFLAGVLTEFDCHSTVPSDIAKGQLSLPPQDVPHRPTWIQSLPGLTQI